MSEFEVMFRAFCRDLLTGEKVAPIFADWLADQGDTRAEWVRGWKLNIDTFVTRVYEARRNKAKHPEGKFQRPGDRNSPWYPSENEEQGDVLSRVKFPPTSKRSHPLAYMSRCRTKAHCLVLCLAALKRKTVPKDVDEAYNETIALQLWEFFQRFPEVQHGWKGPLLP